MAKLMARWLLPTPGGPRKITFLLPLHEAELVQALDLLALEAGLEDEVEIGEGLHRGEPAASHGGLQAARVAQRDLRAQHPLDRLGRGHGAGVDPAEDRVQRLQRR